MVRRSAEGKRTSFVRVGLAIWPWLISGRFRISVRVRGIKPPQFQSACLCFPSGCAEWALQGARAEMVIALPSARERRWRSDHGSFQAAFVFPSACAGWLQTYLHIGSVQDSLRPLAQSGAARGVCGNGYSTSLCP